MKTIQPVTIWINGEDKQANRFSMAIIADNLDTSATFYYQLLEGVIDAEGNETTTSLAQGNLTMTGPEYDLWNGSNNAAYAWGAAQLNLTLI